MDLLKSIEEAKISLNLFLENRFDLAEKKMEKFVNCSIYHSLVNGLLLMIRALMSFERSDIHRAIEAIDSACSLIQQFRGKQCRTIELIFRMNGSNNNYCDYSEEQLHAELCYAELLMIRAILCLLSDETLKGRIGGLLRIRSCFNIYFGLYRFLKENEITRKNSSSHSKSLWREFEAGVCFGFGLFNLLLASIPPKMAIFLQLAGICGDKCSKFEDTLRSPLASISILFYQLVLVSFIGVEKIDSDLCEKIFTKLNGKYPKGAILLFLRARYRLVSRGHIDESVQLYWHFIRSQSEYKQFHHICHWELAVTNIFLMHWARAAWHANKLFEETIYAYLLAVCIEADNSGDFSKNKEAVRILMRKVPENRIKIAGKSIPMEKFVEKRALKWLQIDEKDKDCVTSHRTFLPQFELIYLCSGFGLLSNGSCPWIISPILNYIDKEWEDFMQRDIQSDHLNEERLLWLFLRAVCLVKLGEFNDAVEIFQKIIQSFVDLFLRARFRLESKGHKDESVQLYWRYIRSQSEYK
uniref:TPR_REGION domain-containing protein n=1 Tax=Meloidogyne hapla TaxID=6305 RepID=A0A1I8BM00_MELHA